MQNFINQTWIERYNTEISSQLLTLLWSTIVSIFPLGGLVGASVGGAMTIRCGRWIAAFDDSHSWTPCLRFKDVIKCSPLFEGGEEIQTISQFGVTGSPQSRRWWCHLCFFQKRDTTVQQHICTAGCLIYGVELCHEHFWTSNRRPLSNRSECRYLMSWWHASCPIELNVETYVQMHWQRHSITVWWTMPWSLLIWLTGIGICVQPLYLGEIAPRALRGAMAMGTSIFITGGILTGQVIGLKYVKATTTFCVI